MDATLDAQKFDAEIAKLIAETAKLTAEGHKLHAEDRKLRRETFWMPFVAGYATLAASIGAVVGFVKLFLT